MAVHRKSRRTLGAHARRLAKWRNLAPPETRHLIDRVVEWLVPGVQVMGFERVDVSHTGAEHITSGSEVCLERVTGDHLDVITFNFEKHHQPRVQIHGSRRYAVAPFAFVRAANLVRSNTRYYQFWGKPWWLPTKLWPSRATDRNLQLALSKIGQLVYFLETGTRGTHISKEVLAEPLSGDA